MKAVVVGLEFCVAVSCDEDGSPAMPGTPSSPVQDPFGLEMLLRRFILFNVPSRVTDLPFVRWELHIGDSEAFAVDIKKLSHSTCGMSSVCILS